METEYTKRPVTDIAVNLWKRREIPVKTPSVGKLIREARELQGISRRALARVCGSDTYLNSVENGKCSPTINKLAEIAHLLGYQLRIVFEKDTRQ
jgi:transcriptional regulator with XRE-family HTH domain